MKNCRSTITLLVIMTISLIFNTTYAQQLSGKATYETTSGITISFGAGSNVTPEQERKMREKLQKSSQKTYELTFNTNESVYQKQENLGDLGGAGASSTSNSKGNRNYKNIAEQLAISERTVMNKPFLVEDSLTIYQWELKEEFKQIGSYSCQKAIFHKIEEKQQYSFSNVEEAETTTVMDTTHIEAWFTPQIPVQHGPDKFHGLPGLIMEVNDGNRTYICSKIELKQGVTEKIDQPKKGKKISKEEFDEIQRKKLKQFTQLYQGKDDGDITIKMKN